MAPATIDFPFVSVNYWWTWYWDIDYGWKMEFGWTEYIYG